LRSIAPTSIDAARLYANPKPKLNRSGERRTAGVAESLSCPLRQVRVRQILNLIDRRINVLIHSLKGKSPAAARRRAAVAQRNAAEAFARRRSISSDGREDPGVIGGHRWSYIPADILH
jgi:hypothetical protein